MMRFLVFALMAGLALCCGLGGCFLRVSSGVTAGVPSGAVAIAPALAGGEDVVASYDGSFGQDGSFLVLVTNERVVLHTAEAGDRAIALLDITGIIVDEDEGRVLIKSVGDALIVPMYWANDRLALAKAVQRAVQARKQIPADG